VRAALPARTLAVARHTAAKRIHLPSVPRVTHGATFPGLGLGRMRIGRPEASNREPLNRTRPLGDDEELLARGGASGAAQHVEVEHLVQ
jgi:hypothetical protein